MSTGSLNFIDIECEILVSDMSETSRAALNIVFHIFVTGVVSLCIVYNTSVVTTIRPDGVMS